MTQPFDPDKTIIKGGRGAARLSPDATVIADATMLAGQDDTIALPKGTRIGDFEILKLIGVGGFGIVYLAHDHSLDRQVALKEYMPASVASRGKGISVSIRSERHADTFAAGLRSFINEAHLLAHFDHPALVKVHRFWETGGTAFMVMPFYDGPTLKQALRDMGSPPSEEWLKDLLSPLLDALQVLHQENCFHRDISPDNIILLKNGQPVLLDFGAARRVIGDMSQNMTVIVKSGFAPIEQYSEDYDPPQGPWTDIYAIGALAYFAIMGKAPSPSTSRVVNDTVVPLAQAASGRYQASFLHAIDRALQVSPKHRPQSVEELLGLLGWSDSAHISIDPEEDFIMAAAIPAAAPEPEPAPAAVIPARKRPPVKLIVGAIGLVIALLIGGTMWLTSPSQQGSSTIVQTPNPPAAVAVPSAMPEVNTPAVVPEPRSSEQVLGALPPGQVADAASSPVPADPVASGTQADSGSQARTDPPTNNAAPAKPAAPVAARPTRPRPPEKRPPPPPPQPAPVIVKRPPAPVEPPPVAAVVTPPPAPAPAPPPPPVLPVEPPKVPAAAAISPVNSCKTAILNWICMKEMCAKPELRDHKECVEWRKPG